MTPTNPSSETRQFGRYELLEHLASGGMGEIYLARMKGAANFEKRCVIKKLLPHLAREDAFVSKFIDEANIVVQLTHGNIVPVFDMGEHNGELYIAMEYIPGADLRSLLKQLTAHQHLLPVPHAVHIVAEVCKGLAYAHRKTDLEGHPLGIIHRDVSPSNILISSEGEVRLVDFGIAKASSSSSQSITGRLQGKFGYMSPEQAQGETLDARSDVFSVGVVLYELLTGVRPFEGTTDLDSLERVKSHRPEPPSALREDIPESLDALVLDALEKTRDRRVPSADALLERLMAFLVEQGETLTASALIRNLETLLGPDFAQAPAPTFEDALELGIDQLLATDDQPNTRTASLPASPDPTPSEPLPDPPPAPDEVVAPQPLVLPEPEPAPRTWVLLLAALVIGGAIFFGWWLQRPGTLSVQSDPEEGVQISIDGERIALDEPIELESGRAYTVRVEREGYVPFIEEITLEPGQNKEIFANLEAEPRVQPEPEPPEPAPPQVPTQHEVFFFGASDAKLFIEGQPQDIEGAVSLSREAPAKVRIEPADEGVMPCTFLFLPEPALSQISGCEATLKAAGSTLVINLELQQLRVVEATPPEPVDRDVTKPPPPEEDTSTRKKRIKRTYRFTSDSSGAQIRVGKGAWEALPKTLEYSSRSWPEEVKVMVRLDGHLPRRFVFEPPKQDSRSVHIDFARDVLLRVTFDQGGDAGWANQVKVNGISLGQKKGSDWRVHVPPGEYDIEARNTDPTLDFQAFGKLRGVVVRTGKEPAAKVKLARLEDP